MILPAQKEWISPLRTDFLFGLSKKDTKKGNVQGKEGQLNEKEAYQKGEAVSKQEDQKTYLFQQITCKIKIRWARLRLLRSVFAKYD